VHAVHGVQRSRRARQGSARTLVLELCLADLADVLRHAPRRLDEGLAKALARQLLRGIAHVHSAGAAAPAPRARPPARAAHTPRAARGACMSGAVRACCTGAAMPVEVGTLQAGEAGAAVYKSSVNAVTAVHHVQFVYGTACLPHTLPRLHDACPFGTSSFCAAAMCGGMRALLCAFIILSAW